MKNRGTKEKGKAEGEGGQIGREAMRRRYRHFGAPKPTEHVHGRAC
jgi:hypothetical protein